MMWAQIMPFVALQLYDGALKDELTMFLVGCFVFWIALNGVFFSSIQLSYLPTFFGTMTGPQYACQFFLTSEYDYQKFDAMFDTNISYTKTIHDEVWVAANVERWNLEKPTWYNIDVIPDKFLPRDVYVVQGGASRSRRRNSGRGGKASKNVDKIHPER